MSGSPYDVVSAPSYGAPVLNWSNFFPHKQQQQGQQQQTQPQQGLLSKLSAFLGGQALPAGSAIPGAVGPTSVGGAPLMQSAAAPMINAQGLGLY